MIEPRVKATSSILIVDDTPANLAVMVEQLEAHGYRVAVAQEGEEGLERAEYIQPDLILLDIMMPGIDGFETCRRLKNNESTQDIPVIFMTALSDTADKVKGFEFGAVDYVTKPLQIEVVLARVHTHLTLRAMQTLLEAKNVQLNQQIRERELRETELQHLATHDRLTNLPNRVLFLDRLEHAIAGAARSASELAVMFIDLDKFKDINDTYGHDVGDELLREVGHRLKQCSREADTVARLGGDEFVCLIEDYGDRADLIELTERIVARLREPISISGRDYEISCSIGISLCPRDSDDSDMLIRQADLAMYNAKKVRRENHQFFDKRMHTELTTRVSFETQLQKALANGELLLHYQPQVDLTSNRIIALEALLRWDSPELGMVLPDVFIPIAEEGKLIVEIGEWVLESVLAQIGDWQRRGLVNVPVALNLAAPQLSSGYVGRLLETLNRHGINPGLVELELTESMSMRDPETTITLMSGLKEIGVSLAIDDFGTGFSNLSYLKRFPVDKLKIDKLFTHGMTQNPGDRSIVSAVLRLAQSLNMSTVAEGVETEGQLRFLLEEGCDAMQGYLFCRPQSAENLEKFIAGNPRLALSSLLESEYTRRVLLVDDDREIFDSFELLASGNGFELLYAADTATAFEQLARQEICTVVCDVRLAEESGIGLLEAVRKMYPRVVRMMMTGFSDRQYLEDGINRAHAHRYIAKPWNPGEVLSVLGESFRQYERR